MEVKQKFHLESRDEFTGLVATLRHYSQKYELEDELKLLRTVQGNENSTIKHKRLELTENKMAIYLDNGTLKAVENEEDDNILVMLLGSEDCWGRVYDYYLQKILPTDEIFTLINDKLYIIEPREDEGYLIIDAMDEEAVGYITARVLHTLILENRLEKNDGNLLLHIEHSWCLRLLPIEEEVA